MAELKTKANDADVQAFIDAIEDDRKRADCEALLKLMKQATRKEPKMWGDVIVGYGSYDYKYPTGNTGTWFLTGFSPRKRYLSVYIMAGFDRYDELMKKLGKFKNGKSCLNIAKLEDIDLEVLKELVKRSAKHVEKHHTCCGKD